MPQVFFSWTMPDKDIAIRLRDRLLNAGIDVWEYTDEMRAGDPIFDKVVSVIEQSRVGILCASDAAAKRPWLSKELTLCQAATAKKTMEKYIVVKVGPLAEETKTTLGIDPGRFILDESGELVRENTYVGLTQAVWEALSQEAPILVPTALFALDKEGYLKMRDTPSVFKTLERLCTAAGMAVADLLDSLEERYGARPEEFAPFYPGTPLVQLVHQTEGLTNAARIAAKKRPIFIRWCTSELLKPMAEQDKEIRELWRYRNSLLIVDSVSALDKTIQNQVAKLPPREGGTRMATVWIPPYTQHSACLEEWIRTLATEQELLDRVTDWSSARSDDVAFDIGTSATLRLFVRRALLEVVDLGPLPGRKAALGQGVPFNPIHSF